MSGRRGYFWIPGFVRPDRGYTREEAIAAVGPGWTTLAGEAWDAVTAAGGELSQVKQRFNLLRVYTRGVPDSHREWVRRALDNLEERSASLCEMCGAPEASPCAPCLASPLLLDGSAAARYREWIETTPSDTGPLLGGTAGKAAVESAREAGVDIELINRLLALTPEERLRLNDVEMGALYRALVRDPEILQGQTTLRGTQIALTTVLEYRQARHPLAEYLADHPGARRWRAEIETLWRCDESTLLRLIESGPPEDQGRSNAEAE
jgi:uncharacterized protein (DUF433 family)